MIFLGCLFDRKKEKEILKLSKTDLQAAANIFQWNLIEGFIENGQSPTIIHANPVGTFPKYYKKLILKTTSWKFKQSHCIEIGCLNLPFIKQFSRYRKCKKILTTINDKNIVLYSAYAPFLKAIYRLPKEYNITLIVPDLPEFYDLSNTHPLRRFLRKLNNNNIEKYLSRVDKFVLLTEYMKEKLPIGNKPYIVIEGISDTIMTARKKAHTDKKVILYAGSYRLSNNIEELLDAFSKIPNDDCELWLCGKGEADSVISQRTKSDPRIKNLGFRTHKEILELEQQSTLLINPRRNDEYTKYSFPSKTMEYLASGTPILMYRLYGIPKEYDKYIYYISNDLAKDITKIINLPKEQLIHRGSSARKWVIENKSKTIQTRKIINLINGK